MAEEGFAMNTDNDPDFSHRPRFRFPSGRKIGVHVLSEYVFCPRAAVIASESEGDGGDEEPNLGPRLDLVIDYHEHSFVEALKLGWGEMRLWLTLIAATVFIVMIVGYMTSLTTGFILSLPVFILLAKCCETLMQITALVRGQSLYRKAPEVEIDPHASEIRRLNWWSLRKAGFDCSKAPDRFEDTAGRMAGKPWRLLKKGSLVIPVIRRQRNGKDWGPQHEVRLSAYCDLIEKCTGGTSPFGVILFADTSDCVIIPNTAARQATYTQTMKNVSHFFAIQSEGTHTPTAPSDQRCTACPFGKPRLFRRNNSETIVNGKPLSAYTTNSHRPDGQLRGEFHSPCGDHFRWVPPHKEAVTLGIAKSQ